MATELTRWTPTVARLPALTIRQPWAWLIVNGRKDIENRSRRTHYRGPLLIHAGQSMSDLDEADRIRDQYRVRIPSDFDFGGVIGVVDVVDCAEKHSSKWHVRGYYGWVLANPRRLKFRACKGSLGTFRPVFDE